MSLPPFAKEHAKRIAELEKQLADLKEQLARKKPGPKPKEDNGKAG